MEGWILVDLMSDQFAELCLDPRGGGKHVWKVNFKERSTKPF